MSTSGQSVATATRVKSMALVDFASTCERCGRDIKTKGRRVSNDGMRLCRDCRGSDKTYRQMRRRGEFIETSDQQLVNAEQALLELEREAS